ncbi:MAG: peptidase S9 [Gammaproteobacteria bacterium RIFCSPLOWO2_02_FULL_56_15]|nr:MAG: peptidase S9 [Gammaproteobacteria bacterium RIFCSPLOWO2_02_FULL_56_15]
MVISVRCLTITLIISLLLVACGKDIPAPPAAETTAAAAAPATPAPPSLIAREVLFGNPERTAGAISPDGRWLGNLAPRDGVLNVYVAPMDNPEAIKPVTNDRLRGIRGFNFAYTGNHVLYGQDVGGDENFQVFAVDLTTGEEKALSPKGSRASVANLSSKIPEEVVISVNDRDPVYFDLIRVNLLTGDSVRLIENKEFAEVYVDDDFALRYAAKQTADGGQEYFTRNGDAWRSWSVVPQEDALTTGLAGLTTDGKTLYMLDSRERNTGAAYAINTGTDERSLLHEDARADVNGAIVHPATGAIQAVSVNYLRNEWTAIDPDIGPDLEKLQAIGDGEISVVSRTLANGHWVVVLSRSDATTKYYLYDRAAGTTTLWFDTRPALADAALAPMHPVEIKSRDGLTLVSYYTLPTESDPDGDGKPAQPLPMALVVHGGPWGRDGYGLNSAHQWLANRGYAVLSVNFRASTGFGKDFVNAGDLEWGRKMHDDLLDGVAWAVNVGIAQEDKVAIMGGSYGGYATLAGLTMTPTEFACGADTVGPSNLVTLLSTIPPYWGPIKKTFTTRVGDETTEDGRKLLVERSPLTYADQIQRPLLIGQGANDPRVKQAESDQIVSAMQSKNIPVTYILYPDEGHGFARPENRLSFNAATEEFFGTCLGGRVEPVGDDLQGSSITVPAGAEILTGLKAALDSLAAAPEG